MNNPDHLPHSDSIETLKPTERFVELANLCINAHGQTEILEDNTEIQSMTWVNDATGTEYDLYRNIISDDATEYAIEVYSQMPHGTPRKLIACYRTEIVAADDTIPDVVVDIYDTSSLDNIPQNAATSALKIVSNFSPMLANDNLRKHVDYAFEKLSGVYIISDEIIEKRLVRADKMISKNNQLLFGRKAIECAVQKFNERISTIETKVASDAAGIDQQHYSKVVHAILETPQSGNDISYHQIDNVGAAESAALHFIQDRKQFDKPRITTTIVKNILSRINRSDNNDTPSNAGPQKPSVTDPDPQTPDHSISRSIANHELELKQDSIQSSRIAFDLAIIDRNTALLMGVDDFSSEAKEHIYARHDVVHLTFYNSVRAIIEHNKIMDTDRTTLLCDLFIDAEQSQVQQLHTYIGNEMKYDTQQLQESILSMQKKYSLDEFSRRLTTKFVRDFDNDLEIMLAKITEISPWNRGGDMVY